MQEENLIVDRQLNRSEVVAAKVIMLIVLEIARRVFIYICPR